MALTTGIFSTGENPAELNQRSFAETITRLFPNGSAPIFGLSTMSGKSKAKAATHGYFSKTLTFAKTTTSGANDSTEVIPVASTAGFVPSMVLKNLRTNENIRIKTVDSSTQITVTRSFGRIAAATMNNADALVAVGTAHEEGSIRPTSRRITTTYVPNFTSIIRNAWALTDTARASLAEAGYNNLTENRQDCGLMHSVDCESTILYSQAVMDTTGATPLHSTQGLFDAIAEYAPSNVNPAGSTTDYDQLVQLMEPAFTYSSNIGNPTARIAFGDSQAIRVVNEIGRKSGNVQVMQTETSFGMQFTQMKFYKGTIAMKEHPLMNGLGVAPGTLLILDMPAVKLAYLDGRDTKAEEYGTNGKLLENGVDGVGGSMTTEFAVELLSPFSCAVITGLTAGVMEPILTDEVA